MHRCLQALLAMRDAKGQTLIDVDWTDSAGMTALCFAARQGSYESVKLVSSCCS